MKTDYAMNATPRSIKRQTGMATLTVAVIMLFLLLVAALFAVRLNGFEQRSAINENRIQLAATVAEAGLNQGLELVKAAARVVASESPAVGTAPAGWLAPGLERWQPCSVAPPAGMMDPCLSEPNAARRATMYRYLSAGSTALPLAEYTGSAQVFEDVGAFPVEYRVAATLCRIDSTDIGNPNCSFSPPTDHQVAITLVSEAVLPTEDTVARQRQIIATFRVIASPPNVPLVAASMLSGLGSAEIIPNPNAGGVGVPLSIWSGQDVNIDSGGTFRTCHLGEWLGNSPSGSPENYDGIQRCENCTCQGLTTDRGLLSGKGGGNEGPDIMDVDNNTNGTLPDSSYFPLEPMDDPNNRFDDSIFEYVLGLDTTEEGATTPRTDCISDENPGGNCEDQALYDLGARIVANCTAMNTSSAGLYWVRGDCHMSTQVGTPSNPVFMMVDGCISANANMQVYGLVYHRATTCADLDNGFSATGGGQIYGAVVTTSGVKIRGSVQFIYNQTVLNNLGNSPSFKRYGVVPSSWSDQACFDADGDCRP